jgi:hypothetical protein
MPKMDRYDGESVWQTPSNFDITCFRKEKPSATGIPVAEGGVFLLLEETEKPATNP